VVVDVVAEDSATTASDLVVTVAVLDVDLPTAAMQPVSNTIPATLAMPTILRARRAGWGGRRRGEGGEAVCMSLLSTRW
jgi:hypothetical protein